jgi:hypothetical protein
MTYGASDLKNYCEVRLMLEGGRVRALAVEHDALEFLWLRDGSNHWGRIFAGCIR